MKRNVLKTTAVVLLLITIVLPMVLSGCGAKKESVLIFTSVEDYVIEDMNARLSEEFPDYDIKYFYNLCGTDDGIAISHHSAAVEGLCDLTDKLTDGKNFMWHTRSGGHDFNIWRLGFYNFSQIVFTR